MSFLEQIFASLEKNGDAVVLQELREGGPAAVTAHQLLAQVQVARAYLRRLRLKKGDRCALLAHNSIRWVAMDLAIMAEGLIAVPLYARQAPAELVAMMKDCWPSVIACGEQSLADGDRAGMAGGAALLLVRNVFTKERGPVEQWCAGRRRSRRRRHHLHLWHVRRSKGRDAERRECRPHAGLHFGAPDSAHEESVDAGGGRTPFFTICHFVLPDRGSCC